MTSPGLQHVESDMDGFFLGFKILSIGGEVCLNLFVVKIKGGHLMMKSGISAC